MRALTAQLQSRVLAKLARLKTKRELLSGAPSEDLNAPADERSGPIPPTPTSEPLALAKVDAKAALLSAFFKDMAAFQPSHEHVVNEQRLQGAADKEEEALLAHFAGFFESDVALQNLVDEEKWLPLEKKGMLKRKARLMQTRAPHGVGVPETTRAPLTSEDYVGTAQYIEELRYEVACEDDRHCTRTSSEGSQDDEAAHTRQLALSWAFAQHQSHATRVREAEKSDDASECVVASRRDEWMTSAYIQQLGAAEQRSRPHYNALRSPFISTRQSFQGQEESLPWQPVWNAATPTEENTVAAQASSEIIGGPTFHRQKSLRRPSPRPKTAAGTSSAACSTAPHSAAFAYHNSRRIRSAQTRDVHGSRPPPGTVESPRLSSPKRALGSPIYSLSKGRYSDAELATETVVTSPAVRQQTPSPATRRSEAVRHAPTRFHQSPAGVAVVEPQSKFETPRLPSSRLRSVSKCDGEAEASASINQRRKKTTTKTKTRHETTKSAAGKRFALQVQELLAVSALVKESEQA